MNNIPHIPVAVVGCGNWGKNLVRNFSELGVLKAVCDPEPGVSKAMAGTYNVPALTLDEILGADSIKAVVVAVPAQKHHEVALKLLRAGKHVFVEKPIALTLPHAQELCDVAYQEKRTLMVGHLLQYHPAFLKLKSMVQEGELGDLHYIYSRRLSLGKIRTHENVLWSFAPHDISMILTLAGHAPEKVHGFAGNFIQPEISDFASVQMSFGGGIKAHVDLSWLNPVKEQRLVVVGSSGMIVFDDQAEWGQKLVLYRHQVKMADTQPTLKKADAQAIAIEPLEPLRNECLHFLRFCHTGEPPYTDGREAYNVLKVLRAADESGQG